ncbi:unnamed protein product [Mytilus edulis]|uniref:Transposon Ty3-I Gag-Pol polyprotein n=1 Tax=Mytilus edulis TaxID=6550 RepID=A0A8S3T0Z3_MYTED|nr:unnamed protein product [Mytilus edulis]
MREEVDRHNDDMLERGVIEPADGPWSSGIVLVKEKGDDTTRFCVDYRKVNDLTVKDAYPLPRIDDSLEQLSGNKWFSTLDLCSGYWQVEIAEKDRPKTAFASRRGLFQFRQMPFGLACAPATFEGLMESIGGTAVEPGSQHQNADALSRIPCRQCGYSSDWKAQQLVQTVSSKPDECERDKEDDTEISLKHLQDNDKNLQIVRQWVQDGHKPNLKNLGEYNYVIKSLWSQFDDLKIQDGVLCKVHRDNNKSRVIVPLTERRRILQQCHDNKTSGHLGIKKTQSRIKDRFYWPGVRHDIVAYIAGCEICAKRKGPNKRQRAPMQSAQHETTGCTPNRMMLGREVATPVDLMYDVPDYLKKIPQNRWAWELQERMEEAHHFVRKHVGQEMVRQKKYYDKQLNWSKFRKDDQVYVFFPIRKAGHSPKFTSYWRGPFRVLKEYSDVNYLINCGRRGRPQVIHVDRMRLCKGQHLRGETEMNELEIQDDAFVPESVLPEIFNEELDSADNIVDQSDSRDESGYAGRPRRFSASTDQVTVQLISNKAKEPEASSSKPKPALKMKKNKPPSTRRRDYDQWVQAKSSAATSAEIIMEEKQEDKLNVALEMRQREIHGTIKLPRIKSFSLNRVVTVRGYERSGKRNRMAFRTLHVTNRFVTQLERTVTYCEGPYLDQKGYLFRLLT